MDELYTPGIASSLREGNTHTLKRNSVSDPIGSIQGLLKLLYSVRISYRFVMTRYMRSEKTSIKHTKLQISSFPPSHPQTVHNVSWWYRCTRIGIAVRWVVTEPTLTIPYPFLFRSRQYLKGGGAVHCEWCPDTKTEHPGGDVLYLQIVGSIMVGWLFGAYNRTRKDDSSQLNSERGVIRSSCSFASRSPF